MNSVPGRVASICAAIVEWQLRLETITWHSWRIGFPFTCLSFPNLWSTVWNVFVFSDYFFCGCTYLHMLVGAWGWCQGSSVGTRMCTCLCGPEVSVRDHLWVHTCAYACGGLRLVLGILSGSPLYSWRWGFLSQARSLLIWLALQAILGGGSVGGSLCLFLKAGTPGGWLYQPGIWYLEIETMGSHLQATVSATEPPSQPSNYLIGLVIHPAWFTSSNTSY